MKGDFKMTYTLTVFSENSVQEEALVNLGFSREFDNLPFSLEFDNLEEALGLVRLLNQDDFNCVWNLEYDPE